MPDETMPRRRRALAIPFPPAWLVANVVVLAVVAGGAWWAGLRFDTESTDLGRRIQVLEAHQAEIPPTDAPGDLVVGIIEKCQAVVSGPKTFDLSGSECNRTPQDLSGTAVIVNKKKSLTVRSADGRLSTIDVAFETIVRVGWMWPPR